jgi:hypothetical protein
VGVPTQIDVRVVANYGKYLGNDIGGARVTIEDARTGELLAQGTTTGGSGVANLMEIPLTRAQVLPVAEASVFSATLDLEAPRRLRVTAFGPNAVRGSANSASLTQWVYPGKDIVGGPQGGGFLLQISGLTVTILNPPTHFLPQTAPPQIEVRANVTMMCGCPIGVGHPPWNPDEFEVTAAIQGPDGATELQLTYDASAPYGAPSQFTNTWPVPANGSGGEQIYTMTVYAFQKATGNTGIDVATVIIPAAASAV